MSKLSRLNAELLLAKKEYWPLEEAYLNGTLNDEATYEAATSRYFNAVDALVEYEYVASGACDRDVDLMRGK